MWYNRCFWLEQEHLKHTHTHFFTYLFLLFVVLGSTSERKDRPLHLVIKSDVWCLSGEQPSKKAFSFTPCIGKWIANAHIQEMSIKFHEATTNFQQANIQLEDKQYYQYYRNINYVIILIRLVRLDEIGISWNLDLKCILFKPTKRDQIRPALFLPDFFLFFCTLQVSRLQDVQCWSGLELRTALFMTQCWH
jgi:hypothetical protein